MRRAVAALSGVLVLWPAALSAQRGSARDSGQSIPPASIVGAASLTGREDIAVRSHVVPARVYVGQQATYEVGVFLSDETRARMRRNPEFVPPEMRTMLAYDLAAPVTGTARIVNGRRYEVHVFRRALFPLAAGTLVIPPARLNYSLPLSTSFFSREETHTERTQPSTLEVRDPPSSDRPRGFSGAVGQLTLDARIDNRTGRAGDPLLLTVSVSGLGNVSLVPRPTVSVAWGDAVAGVERTRLDTAGVLVRGRKEFDFLLTPRRTGALAVPALDYVFFDPYIGKYQTASSSPIGVQVLPGSGSSPVASGQGADSSALLPIRRVYRGDVPRPLPASRWYWMVIVITPIPALLLAMRRRPRARPVVAPAARIGTMVASGHVDPSALRRDYALALAERIPGSASLLSNHLRLARMLRRAGVSPETAADASRLLAEMDASVFGLSPLPPADRGARAQRILKAIDEEALPREEIPRVPLRSHTSAFVALIAAGVGIAIAAEPDADFGDAVAAYDARDLPRARELFQGVATLHPRAADAWANAGSVAWQQGDTAAAAVDWHRALRLEPLAGDVRGYLEFTPGFHGGLLGDVPPIPLSALAVLGAFLWIGAFAAVAAGRSPFVRRQMAGSLAAGALVTALAGLYLADVYAGRHASVVRRAERLRAAPALNAESGAEVLPGELARETGTQTAWTRVRLRDGRSGWIESRNLASLELGN